MIVDLHRKKAGNRGQQIVLLHGLNESLDGYQGVMQELEADFQMTALDLRGHGESGRAKPYRVPEYAQDVLAYLQNETEGEVILVGHSLGGLVAAYLAVNHPEVVRTLILEDPPLYSAQMPEFARSPLFEVFRFVRNLVAEHQAVGGSVESMELIVTQFEVEEPDGGTSPITAAYGESYVSRLARDLHRTDPETLDAVLDGSLFSGLKPDVDLPRIECSTLLVAGQHEWGGAMTAADVQRAGDLIPNCSIAVWDQIGHDLHALRPEEFALLVKKFITGDG